MKSMIQAFPSNFKFGQATIYFINENNFGNGTITTTKKCPFQLVEMICLTTWFVTLKMTM